MVKGQCLSHAVRINKSDGSQRMQAPPEDLIRVWQDVRSFGALLLRGDPGPLPPSWSQISNQVIEQVVQCPLLLDIICAILWVFPWNFYSLFHLLNISWPEFRSALCRLQPIFGNGLSYMPAVLMVEWIIKQPGPWRANMCNRLAWSCIRFRNLIDSGSLPDELWYVSQGEPCFDLKAS